MFIDLGFTKVTTPTLPAYEGRPGSVFRTEREATIDRAKYELSKRWGNHPAVQSYNRIIGQCQNQSQYMDHYGRVPSSDDLLRWVDRDPELFEAYIKLARFTK